MHLSKNHFPSMSNWISRSVSTSSKTPLFSNNNDIDAASDESVHENALSTPNTVMQQLLHRRVIFGTCLALPMLMALLFAITGWLQTAEIQGVSSTKFIDAYHSKACVGRFEQCGGHSKEDEQCCAPGCSCEEVTAYYSQCKPPIGSDDCDFEAAAKSMKKIKKKVVTMKNALKQAESNEKTKHKTWQTLHTKSEAAQHALAKIKKAHAVLVKNGDDKAKHADRLTEQADKLDEELDGAKRDADIASTRIKLVVSRMSSWETALTKQGILGKKMAEHLNGPETSEEEKDEPKVVYADDATPYSASEATRMRSSADGSAAADEEDIAETWQGAAAKAEKEKKDAMDATASWYNAEKTNHAH